MKSRILFSFFVFCALLMCACSGQDESIGKNAGATAEPVQCKAMQTASGGKCLCGETRINPYDAQQWSCMDGIWVCLDSDGCLVGDNYYPMWGYLGDKVPGKIPQMPAAASGYALIQATDPKTQEERLIWSCVDAKCLCGDGEIENGGSCIDEVAPIYEGVVCGSQICRMADTCRDGQCWCGETPQTDENVNLYKCVNGQPVCNKIDGCACNGSICPVGAVCDKNGCTCGVTPVSGLAEPGKYGCHKGSLICIDKEGCTCGDTACPVDGVCRNNQCLCGDDVVTSAKTRRSCAKIPQAVCAALRCARKTQNVTTVSVYAAISMSARFMEN